MESKEKHEEPSEYFSRVEMLHQGIRRRISHSQYSKLGYLHFLKNKNKKTQKTNRRGPSLMPSALREENQAIKQKNIALKKENEDIYRQIEKYFKIEKQIQKKFKDSEIQIEYADIQKLYQLKLTFDLYSLESVEADKEIFYKDLKSKRVFKCKEYLESMSEKFASSLIQILIPKDLVKSSIEEKEKNISKINQKLLEKNQKLKTLMKTNNQLKKKLSQVNSELLVKNQGLNERKVSNRAESINEQSDCFGRSFKNDEEILLQISNIQKEQKSMQELLENFNDRNIRCKLQLIHKINLLKNELKKINHRLNKKRRGGSIIH